jgi:serine/threonine-protein kinase
MIGCSLAVHDPPVLVLELAEGGSVRDLIQFPGRAPAPLAVPTVLRIARQMITAVAWLHHNEVIHRDVKPGNVLMMADGTVRLADLGVAAHGDPPRGLPAGWIEEDVGTLGYAAPELLRDASAATPAVDVYGLGAALYEMVSARLPYDMRPGEDEREFRSRVASGAPPVGIQERAEVPGALARAIMQAIAPDPAERFPTVAAFAAGLSDR